jgi:hypothetical protein
MTQLKSLTFAALPRLTAADPVIQRANRTGAGPAIHADTSKVDYRRSGRQATPLAAEKGSCMVAHGYDWCGRSHRPLRRQAH